MSIVAEPGDWWLPQSGFSRAIRGSFSDPEQCEMRWHWWTARNTHEARIVAGIDLAQEILEHCDGDQRVHIVGHSHGGNIALLAANRLPSGRISSIVLLATPGVPVQLPQPKSCNIEDELGPKCADATLKGCGGQLCHWLYWGDAANRVQRIFNLYSPDDWVQFGFGRFFHGVKHVRPSRCSAAMLAISRQHNSGHVRTERILWKTKSSLRTHSAMHSARMGVLTGHLIQGQDFTDAMTAAELRPNKQNEIEDAGRGIDVGTLPLGNPNSFKIPSATDPTVGVLLIHGFTASPAEMRPLAEYIHRETGWLCHGVLLPGHGTTVESLKNTGWQQWRRAANEAYDQLARSLPTPSKNIFLVGVSMGASLCCAVARDHENDPAIKGLILLAPAFGISRWKKVMAQFLAKVFPDKCAYKGKATERYYHAKSLWSYTQLPLKKILDMTRLGEEAFVALERIHAPTYVFAGELDRVVSRKKIQEASELLKRMEKGPDICVLPHSEHILTVEPDRQTVFKECLAFMIQSLNDRS
jgi:carboxylesterase